MKIKDIEKKLRREQDGQAVPDVYTRVKKAPLNKLLLGETPIRAFRKNLATRLLAIACILFIVSAIALAAMWFTPSNIGAAPDCYASIALTRTADGTAEGAEDYCRIGVLMDAGGAVISITVELENGEPADGEMTVYSALISDFISPKANDKVSIGVLCGNLSRGFERANKLADELRLLCDDGDLQVVSACNDYATKLHVAQFIKAHGGDADANQSNAELISAYSALAYSVSV